MFDNDDLLDAPPLNIEQPIPPPVVSFEKYAFPIIFIIQYFCLLQLATASGFDGIFGVMIGGALLFFTGVWQLIGGLLYMIFYPNDKSRRLYFILAISDLALIFICLFLGIEALAFFFAFVTSHVLAWFYWYLSKKDSDLRDKMKRNF